MSFRPHPIQDVCRPRKRRDYLVGHFGQISALPVATPRARRNEIEHLPTMLLGEARKTDVDEAEINGR